MVGGNKKRASWLPERLSLRDALALACATLIAYPAQLAAQSALPTGGNVTHGSATIGTPAGGNMTIDQSSAAAIVEWGSFSVGQPNSVQFNNGNGATLNRVIGADPSQIHGALGATGSLYLINENGITVGPTGRIQTGGNFVGSTRDIANDDFLNGGANTFAGSSTGDIVNQGSITSLGGDVVLIARQVTNNGDITAAAGTAALGAGNEVMLNDVATADGLMFVKLPNADASVTHDGTINAASAELRANGGNVYTLAGNRTGEIHATGTRAEDGRIFLTAENGNVSIGAKIDAARGTDGGDTTISGNFVSLGAPIDASGTNGGSVTVRAKSLSLPEAITATGTTGKGGTVDIDVEGDTLATGSGSIDVSGAEGGDVRFISRQDLMSSADIRAVGTNGKGGNIDISGGAVRLFSPTIDASGTTGGGRVRIGGEYQGGKNLTEDELPNAKAVAATDATTVRADATGEHGDGGTIIFWADHRAAILADITARPGSATGKGGFVEISAGDDLKFAGTASTGIGERKGTVLLDPKNIVVADAVDQSQFILGGGYGFAGFSPEINDGALADFDQFGRSVSLDGTRLAVGANFDRGTGSATGDRRGAVYLFSFTDDAFAGGQLAGVIGSGYTGGNNIDLNASGSATPLDNSDIFGSSVSLDGTRLAVGALSDDGTGSATGEDRGAVYLFSFTDEAFAGGQLAGVIGSGYTDGNSIDLNADGSATPLDDSDRFGVSVSLDGTRLAVGATGDDGTGSATGDGRGAVYLFSFTDEAFAGGQLAGVIGSGYTGGNNIDLNASGSATPLDDSDDFGTSVSLDGTRLAVGARLDHGTGSATGEGRGAVYLFSFTDDAFAGGQLAGVIGSGYTGGNNIDLNADGSATPLDNSDTFGFSVSLDGTRLAVGAPGDDGTGSATGVTRGSVYLFSFADNAFAGGQLAGVIGSGYMGGNSIDLNADGSATPLDTGDEFGVSVSLDGTRLAVGARGDDGTGGATGGKRGAVYLFNFTDETFAGGQVAGVVGSGYTGGNNIDLNAGGSASPLGNDDEFGTSVSLDGTRLAVGAMGDDGTGSAIGEDRGAVYLFSFTDEAFAGGQLAGVIGSGYTGGNNIDLNAGGSATPLDNDDDFGVSVSLDGNRLAVGAWRDEGTGSATGDSRGAVYLFSFADDAFTGGQLAGVIGSGYTGGNNIDLNADGSATPLNNGDQFGVSVSLDGTRLAVGARLDDGFGIGRRINRGAVYLFSFTDEAFAGGQLAGVIGSGYTGGNNIDLNASGSTTPLGRGAFFGDSVSLDGTRLAVGASSDNGTGSAAGRNRGAVYLFSFTDETFAGGQVASVIGSGYTGGNNIDLNADGSTTPLDDEDGFGASVSLDGTRLAVGAPGDDGTGSATGSNRGAIYLFSFTDEAFAGGQLTNVIGSGYAGGNNIDLNADGSATPLDDVDAFGDSVFLDGNRLAVGATGDDGFKNGATSTGAVHLFTGLFGNPATPVADAQFNTNPAGDATITPASLTALLNAGNNVLLQANNNITFKDAVIANNPGGDGGNLSAHAGNSIFVNANITTDNGDLTFRANGDGADGWVKEQREDGTANIVVANGIDIDAGTGDILWTLFSGGGASNAIAGNISFEGDNSVTASSVRLFNNGEDTSRHGINLLGGTQITASGAGNAIVTSSKHFMNNAGANLFNLTGGGRFIVNATSNDTVARGGLAGGNFYGINAASNGPNDLDKVTAAGNRFAFAEQPTLTVTVDDVSREYGLANPDFTFTTSGLINGDSQADAVAPPPGSLRTTANTASNVGDYKIDLFGGAISLLGYNLEFEEGTLEVEAATLTVAPHAQTREYGVDNPALTVGYSGFRNGDRASIALTGAAEILTRAAITSNVGNHEMLATRGTLASNNGNYKFDFGKNFLTVTPAPLTVTANDAAREEGTANPAFSATLTGLRNGDNASVVQGLGFASNAVTASPAGRYAISPIGGKSLNYTLTRVDGVLTVTAANGGGNGAGNGAGGTAGGANDNEPGTSPATQREAIAATVRIVETQDTSAGFSLAPIFNNGISPGAGGIITASIGNETGGTQGATGSDGDQIVGRLVVEVEVEGDTSSPGTGAFSFQLPPDFTGCAGEGACDGVPDSVFFSSFAVAN